MTMVLLLSVSFANAQIKNSTTESVKINGNCSMCKKTIETAANQKKVAQLNWDENTKIATVTYDAKKTNINEILKRVALAGYDSEKATAPDDVYNQLHGCCQYEREPNKQ